MTSSALTLSTRVLVERVSYGCAGRSGGGQQAAGSQLTSILCRISASVSRLAQADGDSLFAETGGFGSHGVRCFDKDVRNDVPAATGVDAEERPEAHDTPYIEHRAWGQSSPSIFTRPQVLGSFYHHLHSNPFATCHSRRPPCRQRSARPPAPWAQARWSSVKSRTTQWP